MTRINKQKKKKKYRYNVNRKRMNKKRFPALASKTIKNAWNKQISSNKNFIEMGIVFDVNKDIKTLKEEEKKAKTEVKNVTPVVKELEEDAHAIREKGYKLPKHQVEYLIYLMDKYGDDYKSMVKDKKNYLQQTWKQLRSKINTFKSIPEQYNEYLSRKNKNVCGG